MLRFDTTNARISRNSLLHLKRKLSLYTTQLSKVARRRVYSHPASSICLPSDKKMLKKVRAVVSRFGCDLLVIVGIGGSNLGAMAVEQAVGNSNLNSKRPVVLYADTVDSRGMQLILDTIQQALKRDKRVVVNIVTKSGTTTESVANSACILKVLHNHRIPLSRCVVVTTNKNSKLWRWASDNKVTTLEIPAVVGGRYSVFSPVGLLPLGLMGFDLKKLLHGAERMRGACVSLSKNPAIESASILYYHLQRGLGVHDSFFFDSHLEALGKWYRQLLAESLGKHGKGILPTVSVGTTDLHSVAQLTLGGPRRAFTTFIDAREGADIRVPTVLDSLAPVGGHGFDEIRRAILAGTKLAYKSHGLPFLSVTLDECDEESIGAFMQWKMLEVMFFARLLGVNAFDQPNVEEYKDETRKRLSTTPIIRTLKKLF